MIPAKADPDQQVAYLTQELEPRLAEAQAGKRAVFFMDAAHFVLAPFLGFLWSVARIFIQAPSGRQRFNVLGALNALTHELVTVTNETYITAQSVCELLQKLAALNLGVPITLFLDNARYTRHGDKLRICETGLDALAGQKPRKRSTPNPQSVPVCSIVWVGIVDLQYG